MWLSLQWLVPDEREGGGLRSSGYYQLVWDDMEAGLGSEEEEEEEEDQRVGLGSGPAALPADSGSHQPPTRHPRQWPLPLCKLYIWACTHCGLWGGSVFVIGLQVHCQLSIMCFFFHLSPSHVLCFRA